MYAYIYITLVHIGCCAEINININSQMVKINKYIE